MEEKKLWRKVQVRKCISVILIFLGIILMQMMAYLICVTAYTAGSILKGNSVMEVLNTLSVYMTESSFLIWISAVSASLCLIWCGILYYRSDWRVRPFSYRKAFRVKNTGMILAIGFGGCVVLTMLVSVLAQLLPEAFSSYTELMANISYKNSWITVLYVLLIGPVSEEMIFRGAIMDRLRIAFPFWLANVLQAALFGLYHMNLIQGLYAFLLGLVLGLICRVTGSIFAAALTHIIFNSTSYLMEIFFPGERSSEAYILFGVVLFGIILFSLGIKYYIKEYRLLCVKEDGEI